MNGPDLARAVSSLVRRQHPNAWWSASRDLAGRVDSQAIIEATAILEPGPLPTVTLGEAPWMVELYPHMDVDHRERLLREGEVWIIGLVGTWLVEIRDGTPIPELHLADHLGDET